MDNDKQYTPEELAEELGINVPGALAENWVGLPNEEEPSPDELSAEWRDDDPPDDDSEEPEF